MFQAMALGCPAMASRGHTSTLKSHRRTQTSSRCIWCPAFAAGAPPKRAHHANCLERNVVLQRHTSTFYASTIASTMTRASPRYILRRRLNHHHRHHVPLGLVSCSDAEPTSGCSHHLQLHVQAQRIDEEASLLKHLPASKFPLLPSIAQVAAASKIN